MAVPTYRCPFKVDPDTTVGIVCENTSCGAYNATDEQCTILQLLDSTVLKPKWMGQSVPVTSTAE